jgi:hypothetical protein
LCPVVDDPAPSVGDIVFVYCNPPVEHVQCDFQIKEDDLGDPIYQEKQYKSVIMFVYTGDEWRNALGI